jgi:hypothetical protein
MLEFRWYTLLLLGVGFADGRVEQNDVPKQLNAL